MSTVVIVGGGFAGLAGAMLLARDGHRVTVLERDTAPPPEPCEAWTCWQRRGVAQFRQPHGLLPRCRELLETELPDVAIALEEAGALRANRLLELPAELTGGCRPGDERFEQLTGRRPMVEATLAALAAASPGSRSVAGWRCAGSSPADMPPASRGSPESSRPTVSGSPPISSSTPAGGARACPRGSARSEHGRLWTRLPPRIRVLLAPLPRRRRDTAGLRGPVVQHYDSISLATLSADNRHWSVVLVTASGDDALRPARRPDVWERVVRSYPLVAHWLDAEPVTGVDVMANVVDRVRRLVVDGAPIVTGLIAVGDASGMHQPVARTRHLDRSASGHLSARHAANRRRGAPSTSPSTGTG